MAKHKKFTTTRNTAYQIKAKAWKNYTERLRSLSETASKELEDYIRAGHTEEEILDVAYALVTKYGEASSELACQMYEAIAAYSGAEVAAAEAAATATYSETAKSIRGTMKRTKDAAVISSSAGRLVKMASVDTMMKNALRDGAEWAWIPQGDTCAYCIMLASRGWVKASEDAINNGHAEHIHNNCDCTYCVRFDHETTVEGYGDGEEYYAMYHDQKGIDQSILDDLIEKGYDMNTPKGRMAALRRQYYANNREHINAQKRAAYGRRSSTSESDKTTTEDNSRTLKNERKLDRILNKEPIRYGSPTKVTQDEVNRLINDELSGVRFKDPVVVNPRLKRAQGRVIPILSETNREIGVERIEIGQQDRNTKECLINTLVHENLESKILKGYIDGKDKYWRLYRASNEERHEYIDKVIERYFRMKGWDYGSSY